MEQRSYLRFPYISKEKCLLILCRLAQKKVEYLSQLLYLLRALGDPLHKDLSFGCSARDLVVFVFRVRLFPGAQSGVDSLTVLVGIFGVENKTVSDDHAEPVVL